MAVIELPIVFQADASARRRRHDRIWVYSNGAFAVEETSSPRHQLLCRYKIPRSGFELEWRMIDGMIMRPLVYELQPHFLTDELYPETLGPDDDPEIEPFRDHPSFAAVLTSVWPRPARDTIASIAEEERHRDFRFWRWDERDEREKTMRNNLVRYRLAADVLWKEAPLPCWIVTVRDERVDLTLSHADASACHRVEGGFHFNLEHRDAAFAFARWVSNYRFEPPDIDPPRSSVDQAIAASDQGTGYSVAKFLADEISGRASWRLSPGLTAVFAEFRLAHQQQEGHSYTRALAMLEALSEMDLATGPLRRLVHRLRKRQEFIGRCTGVMHL